jgi:hypothetical protein
MGVRTDSQSLDLDNRRTERWPPLLSVGPLSRKPVLDESSRPSTTSVKYVIHRPIGAT